MLSHVSNTTKTNGIVFILPELITRSEELFFSDRVYLRYNIFQYHSLARSLSLVICPYVLVMYKNLPSKCKI